MCRIKKYTQEERRLIFAYGYHAIIPKFVFSKKTKEDLEKHFDGMIAEMKKISNNSQIDK